MRPNKKISNCISLLLILLLFQKMGAGLCFHNVFHIQNKVPFSNHLQVGVHSVNNCNCIDDFCAPFQASEPPLQQSLSLQIELVSLFHSSFSLFPHLFHSLRGPPLKA
ncbi:MAG TPA: hypothetical protein VLJ68_12700 [Chitinophagaceae bacterium]|nr:hypothetical protein [Chitinophagaceae bacterium]